MIYYIKQAVIPLIFKPKKYKQLKYNIMIKINENKKDF